MHNSESTTNDIERLTKPKMVSDHQWGYQSLHHQLGEEEANKHIAARLRELADIVESDDYPRVFGWTDGGDPCPIATYQLTISYPWGG